MARKKKRSALGSPRPEGTEPATYLRPPGYGALRVSEDFVPFGEFRANASQLIRGVRETGRPVVVTQHGRPAAVVVSVQWYDRIVDAEYVHNAIREGLADLEAGRVVPHEQVMAGLAEIAEKHRKRHEEGKRESRS